jgi:WD40 repeat protein
MTGNLSSDGKRLAAHLFEGNMELWDMVNRKKIATASIHRSGNFGSWFSADSKTILTGSIDGDDQLTISLWNANTGELIDKSVTYTITNYAVSPDAKRYLTLSAANHVIVWDGISLKPLQDRLFEKDSIRQIAISHDDASFGVLTRQGIKLYNMKTMDSIAMISAGDQPIRSFSFDPGNKFIVTIAYNGDINCWNKVSGKRAFSLGNYDKQDYGWLARVVYDKNGKRLAVSYGTNKVSVWDIKQKKKIMEVQGDKHLVLPSFNKNGDKLLLSEGYNGISTWHINTGKKWKVYHQ